MLITHDSARTAAGQAIRIRRALVSVFDKQGLIELGACLADLGIEIISTGGTAERLSGAGIPVTQVDALTGFPEILDGRVKTLHPAVHAGILFQRQVESHRDELDAHGIRAIDLVIVNLYPFAAARRRAADLPELLEHIDIGGPAMARAAAKNFPYVAVVSDPQQYKDVISELRETRGSISGATRARLAQGAFRRLSEYDQEVAAGLGDALALPGVAGDAAGTEAPALAVDGSPPALPAKLGVSAERVQELRYGENPHQRAALYATGPTLRGVRILQGKELSYNNLLDVHAVVTGIRELGRGGCVVVKHASPSGIAVGDSQRATFMAARDADPLSAFGGIIAVAEPLSGATAEEIARDFYEVVVAPGFAPDAREILAKKKNLRLLDVDREVLAARRGTLALRSIFGGGYLLQESDQCLLAREDGEAGTLAATDEVAGARVVSQRPPTPDELAGLRLAWTGARLVRSNAIVLCRADRSIGIGGGQASRIDAVEVAALKAARAGHDTRGSVLASDGFFPFRDCVDRAASLGVTAIIQPGGSKRDRESVDAANQHGIALMQTGRRHFLH